ncbi:MAG: biotin--[acetyl-CoA-carboxylase] ligase [Nitrospirae bacterium]|nr:biotin--[acetyl-CoA-carboxylase] ligase [Nitrospirota bacterium]
MFTKEEIISVFRGDIIGREIIYSESTTSTNDMAFEVGRNRTDPEGIVVVADTQTQGKGRLGRSWISPAGVNLYFTLLLNPPISPEDATIISLAAPAAVAAAIRKHTGLPAQIKWPNDIHISSKKAGGILVEMKANKDNTILLAVGIGINVNMPPDALPPDIRPLSTSLKTEKGKSIDRLKLLREMLSELENSYKFLLHGNKRALINDWVRLNSTIGRTVSVQSQERTISGIAENINDKGELLVRLSSGDIEVVRAGDVTILK